MSDNHADPSGDTEAFRAFTQNPSQEPAASRTALIAAAAVGAVVLLALLIWLLT